MLAVAVGLFVTPAAVSAQTADSGQSRAVVADSRPDSLLVGGVARDRARLREITGRAMPDAGIPSDSLATAGLSYELRAVLPALRYIDNSDIAYSANDGAMWAGRGGNVAVSGGVQGSLVANGFTVELSLVPAITYSANRPFQILPGAEDGRSGFSSPFHTGPRSADIPLRFGASPIRAFSFGESSLRVSGYNAEVGAGFMTRWWGPGIRNAILLSSNAPPIPQLYLSTRKPVRTPIGDVSGLLMAGMLTESPYFDMRSGNDHRALSGLRVEFRPTRPGGLSIGFAHLVMRYTDDALPFLSLHEAITRWDRPHEGEPVLVDQMLAMDARWIFPEAGFEVYGEWARLEPPRSPYDWAVATHYSQGYTVGAQWAAPVPRGDRIRVQTELTYLEQSSVSGHPPAPSYYVGRSTAHGFTQRGQVLGAAIGPGGSSQWLAADYVAPTWMAGAFVGRTRWENDEMYQQPWPNFYLHDVTIQSGVRGSYSHRLGDIGAELAVGRRMNYLFQSSFGVPGGYRDVDVQNITFGLTLTPRYPAAALVRRVRTAAQPIAPSPTTASAP